jgi:hypothetical protein
MVMQLSKPLNGLLIYPLNRSHAGSPKSALADACPGIKTPVPESKLPAGQQALQICTTMYDTAAKSQGRQGCFNANFSIGILQGVPFH